MLTFKMSSISYDNFRLVYQPPSVPKVYLQSSSPDVRLVARLEALVPGHWRDLSVARWTILGSFPL